MQIRNAIITLIDANPINEQRLTTIIQINLWRTNWLKQAPSFSINPPNPPRILI